MGFVLLRWTPLVKCSVLSRFHTVSTVDSSVSDNVPERFTLDVIEAMGVGRLNPAVALPLSK